MASINKQKLPSLAQWQKFIKDNWVITLIIIFAALMRSWDISSRGILFSDAAKDLLMAKQAVESQNIPLLGIPSSVPRFHQGPLTIWLEMIIYSAFGQNTFAFSIIFAFLGILAVIAVYEYAVVFINKKTALISSALLAFSPLAIAHSRVPYHTNPIPFVVMIYLFALQYLWKNKRLGVFGAGLAWILIMQFELTLFSLGLLIPYILWRKKIKIDISIISQFCAALLLGLLPQIIHDLTSSFSQSQIGGFILWIGYRITSLTGLVGNHQFSVSGVIGTFAIYGKYIGRIFSTQNNLISLVFFGLLLTSLVLAFMRRRSLKIGLEITIAALILLTLSYFVHGTPSEAYFPPYFPLLSLLIGWGLSQIFHKKEILLKIFIGIWALINISSIFKHNFFVSNVQDFSYNPSVQEQRQIIKTIDRLSEGRFQLLTTHPAGKFPSYFDNLRWLAGELGIPKDGREGMVFYIEPKNSSLSGYPNITKIEFTTYDVYHPRY
jgi:4-amino-4-deoxy-L-arabinose transferase-like glycosyltransferase